MARDAETFPNFIMRRGPFGEVFPAIAPSLVRALLAGGDPVALDDAAVDLAFVEEVAPLLGAAVAQGRVVVPPTRWEQLSLAHQLCIATNVVRQRAVEPLVALCRQVGVPLVPLKGLAMIQATMTVGERSMGDVDLLVPASRWHEVCDSMPTLGFRESGVAGRGYTGEHDYVRSFSNPVGVIVELHRFVCEASFLRIDYEGPSGIFACARPTSSGMAMLDAGDLFLTLAAHAAKHTFELPLRSFLDGLILLRRGGLSLGAISSRARGWRMSAAFEMWMRCLRVLTPTTAEVALGNSSGLSSGRGGRLERLVWSHTSHASPWQRFLRMAWLTDSGADWVRHVVTRLGFRTADVWQVLRSTEK